MIVHLTRKSKSNYYKQYFEENKNNLKTVWDGIKSIINSKSNTNESPTILNMGKKTISDPITLAVTFNTHFATIAQQTKKTIPP